MSLHEEEFEFSSLTFVNIAPLQPERMRVKIRKHLYLQVMKVMKPESL